MLSAIREKLNSLSVRLPLIYIISVTVFLFTFASSINFIKTNQAYNAIQRSMEISIGFPNGVTQSETPAPPMPADLTARQVVRDFSVVDNNVGKIVLDDAGLPTSYTIDSGSDLGLVTIYLAQSHISSPVTVNQLAQEKFFIETIAGYDTLLVVSVNQEAMLALDDATQTFRLTLFILPGILALAAVFGLFVIRRAVMPLADITQTAEMINESDIQRRVSNNSADEIGRLANSFNRMADRLDKAFEREKRFISDAAHELRTPLASSTTMVSFALSNHHSKAEMEQILVQLSSRLETMERLINDLLVQARADECSSSTEKYVANLASVIAEATEAFEPLFEEKGIIFSNNTPKTLSNLPPVSIDPKQLLTVFSNLLDNAVKNTPAGGAITIETCSNEIQVTIQFKDTGRGIAPEAINKIFDRFYKVPFEGPARSGFGLGLSICKSIVSRFGGNISVTSELGKGSIFMVTLPFAKE